MSAEIDRMVSGEVILMRIYGTFLWTGSWVGSKDVICMEKPDMEVLKALNTS